MMAVNVVPFFLVIVAIILFPYNIVAGAKCYDAFDIVQVQDVSPSFHRFLPKLTAKVDGVMRKIAELGPDAYFGLATFGDKNIAGINQSTKKKHILGSKKDYCLRVDVPLQKLNATKIINRFNKFQRKAAGKGDAPGAVLEAMYRALIASKLRWRHVGAKKVLRFVVVVTGATSHLPGDVHKLTGKNVRPFDITAGRENENYDCNKVDYPSAQQFKDLFLSMSDDIGLLLFSAPGGANDSEGRFKPYESLAGLDQEYQKIDGLSDWYLDALKGGKRLETAGAGQLDDEMANYEDYYGKLVAKMKDLRCP